MPHRPGRIFANDTLNSGVGPLRVSLCVLLFALPGLLWAQARLPTAAVAVNPDSGQVVYRERRSSVYGDDEMKQSDVVCLSDQGEVQGRINLNLGGEYPELDWRVGDTEHLHLSRPDERWVARYTSYDRVQTQVSWPRLRRTDLIEDQLLDYLQTHVDALKSQTIDKLVIVRVPELRRQAYAVSVSMLNERRLDVRLRDEGWFAKDDRNMRFVLDTKGRILGYQGPARCPLASSVPQRVDVRYIH